MPISTLNENCMMCQADQNGANGCRMFYGLGCSDTSECYDEALESWNTGQWNTANPPLTPVVCDGTSKTCCSPDKGYCDPNAYGTERDKFCCGSLICDSLVDSVDGHYFGRCCKGAGETCNQEGDCCDAHGCGSDNKCCINNPNGPRCSSLEDCCSGFECDKAHPSNPTGSCCKSAGEPCNDPDCYASHCCSRSRNFQSMTCCPTMGDTCSQPSDCCVSGQTCGSDNKCCWEAGEGDFPNYCGSDQDCCGDLLCKSDGECCAKGGATCSSSGQCCSLSCASIGGGSPACCPMIGEACSTPADCCGLGTCGSDNKCCAELADNYSCTSDDQCCGDLQCTSYRCCKAEGAACTTDYDCCTRNCESNLCACKAAGEFCNPGNPSECCSNSCPPPANGQPFKCQ